MGKKFSRVTIIFFILSIVSYFGVVTGFLQELYGILILLGPIPYFLALAFIPIIIVNILLVVRDRIKIQYSIKTKTAFITFLVFLGLFLSIPIFVIIVVLVNPNLMNEYSPWFYIVPIAAPIIFLGGGLSGIFLLAFWISDKADAPQIDIDNKKEEKKFSLSTKVLFITCIVLSIWCFLIGGFIELFMYIAFILPLTIPWTIISAVKDKARIQYTVVTKIFFSGMMLCLGLALYGIYDYILIDTKFGEISALIGIYGFVTFCIISFILRLRDRPTLEEKIELKKKLN